MYNNKPKAVSRKTQLAQIHIAKKDLLMDDETYRLFIKNNTGQTSSATLDMHGRFKLLKAFENAGWVNKKKPNAPGKKRISYTEKQSRYMIILWGELFKQSKVDNKDSGGNTLTPNVAMERFIANQIREKGQDLPRSISPDKLDGAQRNKLTEQLKHWVERK